MIEADVAHVFRLLNGWHLIEDILLENAIACIGVNGEIADTEAGEVLEKVGTLRGIDMIVFQTRLHNDTGGRDMRPLDGDTQPIVAATPTSWTNEHIVLILVKELLIDLLDMRGNRGIIGSGEILISLDIDHIDDILRDTVSQRVLRAQQTVGIWNLLEILIEHLLRVDNRPDLEQIEFPGAVVIQITGELDFDGTSHFLRAILLRHLEQFGQGEDTLLENATEGNHLTPTLVDTIADNLIHRVIGRGDIRQ